VTNRRIITGVELYTGNFGPWSTLQFIIIISIASPDHSAQVLSAVRRSRIVVKNWDMASQSSVLEQQNNQRLEELSRKVTSLRNVSPFVGFGLKLTFW